MKKKHILFAIVGKVPNVITEALWCLKIQRETGPIDISRVVVITTGTGKKIMLEGNPETGLPPFLGEDGAFGKFCKDYKTFPSLRTKDIHVIQDESGIELPDVRYSMHFEMTANKIISVLRELVSPSDTELHCLYSGGRRAMAVYMGLALTLLGRRQDHFYYVSIAPDRALTPTFFYPTGSEDVEIRLEEIPFARLGEKYTNILAEESSYSELVENIQTQVDLTKPAIVRFRDEPVVILGRTPKFKQVYCSPLVKPILRQSCG